MRTRGTLEKYSDKIRYKLDLIPTPLYLTIYKCNVAKKKKKKTHDLHNNIIKHRYLGGTYVGI